jgi:hypothetical protein
VLSVSGGVSSGAFSKDFSKLLIGDATGKVHLLGIANNDTPESGPSRAASRSTLAGKRAPNVIIPHQELAPPGVSRFNLEVEQAAQDMARVYLEEGHIRLHPDRRIGAVQGQNYPETMLFRFEAHEQSDATQPLLPHFQAMQQERTFLPAKSLVLERLPTKVASSCSFKHTKNVSLDFDISRLSESTQNMFKEDKGEDRLEERFGHDDNFELEIAPRRRIFKSPRRGSG